MYLSWKNKAGKEITIYFDATTRESIESVLSITTHPVEEGADITDHAHEGPDKISLEGYVTNKPLPSNPGVHVGGFGPVVKESSLEFTSVPLVMTKPDLVAEFGEEKPNLLDSIKGVAGAVSPGGLTKLVLGGIDSLLHKPPDHAMVFKGVDGWEDRARRVYTLLRLAQKERSRIEVGVKLVTLEDMLIAKLNAPRGLKDGGGASFTLDLQRVRIVRSATVDAPVPAESRGAPEKAAGPKAATDDKDKKKELKSLAVHGGIWSGIQK